MILALVLLITAGYLAVQIYAFVSARREALKIRDNWVSVYDDPVLRASVTIHAAFEELESRIWGTSALALRRLGIVAPLLGVFLTVLLLQNLSVEQAQDSGSNILVKLPALVWGVGIGAGLAIVNQAMLWGLSVTAQLLQAKAQESWSGWHTLSPMGQLNEVLTEFHSKMLGQLTETETMRSDVLMQLGPLVGSFQSAISGLEDAANKCDTSTISFDRAAGDLAKASTKIGDAAEQLCGVLDGVNERIASSVEEPSDKMSKAATGLVDVLKVLRTELENRSAASLRIEDASGLAEAAAGRLQRLVDDPGAIDRMGENISTAVQASLQTDAETRSASLTRIEDASRRAERAADRLENIAGSKSKISDAEGRLVSAIDQTREGIEQIAADTKTVSAPIQSASSELVKTTRSLNQNLEGLDKSINKMIYVGRVMVQHAKAMGVRASGEGESHGQPGRFQGMVAKIGEKIRKK